MSQQDIDSSDIYGQFSEFYDIYVGDGPDDFPFYLEYAKSVQTPVLEIGAGSGRLTIPLASAGVYVVAVDVSPSMLAILESRLVLESIEVKQRIQIIEANACNLELGTKYELIIVPFYTFNYFLTPQVWKAALERFSVHLSRQGRLLIDVFVPLSRIEHCSPASVLKVRTLDPRTGNKVLGWNTYKIDKENQMEFRRHVFQIIMSDGTASKKEFTTQRRYFFSKKLEEIFSDSGFFVEDVFTGYKKVPADTHSEQLLYVLRHCALA